MNRVPALIGNIPEPINVWGWIKAGGASTTSTYSGDYHSHPLQNNPSSLLLSDTKYANMTVLYVVNR